ncbi:hypothetical protein LPB79_07780 (plasmid) [Rhizobium sp. T136]|nr:nucleotide-binding domain containing protein [Rhizobium sp. T136]UFS79463.1 hypothetical protein LPB79_07780 [Rhizobium sp. T136]
MSHTAWLQSGHQAEPKRAASTRKPAVYGRKLIYATAAPDAVRAAQDRLDVERAGSLIEDTLAACAQEARDSGYRRFVVAGGETSGAVTKALGVTRLNIGAEIAPGVPWCFASSHNARIAITLKSGNFGNEQFFSKAFEVLEP